MKYSLFNSFFEGVKYTTAICAVVGTTLVCSAHADEAKKLSHTFTFDGAYYLKSDYQKGDDHLQKRPELLTGFSPRQLGNRLTPFRHRLAKASFFQVQI